MIDSKLPAGCEEAARRPPKSGVATATSTRRPRCTPNSTTFSRRLTCWSTTSSPSADAPAGRRGSQTPSYCRSHSRYFWGFRLYLLCASDGTPIAFELAPANAPEREVAREMLERVPLAGLTVIADTGFAGAEFEGWMADRGAEFLRPDRKDEPLQFGSLGRVRQWIESVFWTCKGQLGLERHGARTLPGLCARVGLRLLALAAGLRHNAEIGQPGRCFSAYGH